MLIINVDPPETATVEDPVVPQIEMPVPRVEGEEGQVADPEVPAAEAEAEATQEPVVAVATGENLPQTGGIRTNVLPLAIALIILLSLLFATYVKVLFKKSKK